MKRIVSIAMLMMAMTVNSQAQGRDSSTTTDSIDIPSLDEIIEMEANLSSKNENERHYKRVWEKNTFFTAVSTQNSSISTMKYWSGC